MMAATTVHKPQTLPALPHRRWIEVGRAENSAFIRALDALDESDWHAPTDCEGWTVKDIVAHVLGMAQGFTGLSQMKRQTVQAKKRKKELGSQLNAMNQTQVDDRKHLSPEELQAQLPETFERFIRLRSRLGGPGRFLPMYDSSALGLTNVRYLMDTIFPRDVFMHRIDIHRATGKPFEFLPEDHDLVNDVVRDWARRHRPDVALTLTGPMRSTYTFGRATARVTVDAVEFCRILSGRKGGEAPEIEGDRTSIDEALKKGCPF